MDVAAALRTLWEQHYTADSICLSVVGPQDLELLEGWVAQAFAGVRPGGGGGPAPTISLDVAGPEQLGTLLEVCCGRHQLPLPCICQEYWLDGVHHGLLLLGCQG